MPIKIRFDQDNFKGSFSTPPANPQEGWMYIDTDDAGLYIYYNGAWVMIMTLTAAGAYVLKVGDTMTGDLTLPALHATDSGESTFNDDVRFNGNIILKEGQKLIFDGD